MVKAPLLAKKERSSGRRGFGLPIIGLIGTVAGLLISALAILAMPRIIASSGLMGEFEVSLGSGDNAAKLKFNPVKNSVADLVRQGLTDPKVATSVADVVIAQIKALEPDSEVGKIFREDILSSKRGPFAPDHHWYRDITSFDGLQELIGIEDELEKEGSPEPVKSFKELRRFLLEKVDNGEGIFGTESFTVRFSFPNVPNLSDGTAAVCENSGLKDKKLLVASGSRSEARTFEFVEATSLIDREACADWSERRENGQFWIQLSPSVKRKLFGRHALSVEAGWMDIIDVSKLREFRNTARSVQ